MCVCVCVRARRVGRGGRGGGGNNYGKDSILKCDVGRENGELQDNFSH